MWAFTDGLGSSISIVDLGLLAEPCMLLREGVFASHVALAEPVLPQRMLTRTGNGQYSSGMVPYER